MQRNEREHSERDEGAHVSRWKSRELVCRRISIVRLQSEKREEWIREIKGERLQGIQEDASSTPRLASSSAASFPGKNDCPGTHCSLIVGYRRREKTVPPRSSRKFEVKGKLEERIGWRGQSKTQIEGEEKGSGRLVDAAETSIELAERRNLQQRNLNILGLLKKKEWPQCHRESSWQVPQSRLCQKEKEQSRLSRVTDREGGRESG